MARMIPGVSPHMIENDAEQMFYSACRDLPREYTVFYSYKYKMESSGPRGIGPGQTASTGARTTSAASQTMSSRSQTTYTGARTTSARSQATSTRARKAFTRFQASSPISGVSHPEGPDGLQAIGEADFVVVHPELGYVVFEVKQGNIMYANGRWHEFKPSRSGASHHTRPMAKDPVDQAQKAMWAILERYKEKSGDNRFPLHIRFALCFPETKILAGELPDFLNPNSIFLYDDLDNLDAKIRSLFPKCSKPDRIATQILIDRVLSPSFKVFALLEEQIQMFHSTAERVLTDEQSRILEETELDKKKVFFGAAGTGKTYLAMEKARQLADSGKRVLLTCFNKNLAVDLRRQIPSEITCSNFHDFLVEVLGKKGLDVSVPEHPDEQQAFFNDILPEMGFDYYTDAPEAARFDSIIVDEGQDFHESWLVCLESMLRDREDGEFYIFADPNQDLFGVAPEHLMRLPVSKHRLTRNLRNTETISDWLAPFVPHGHLKPVLRGGIPVTYHPWETPQGEKRMIERETGRLVSQGIRPGRILILSPNRLENSSLAGCEKIGSWPLVDFRRLGAGKFKLQGSPGAGARRTSPPRTPGNAVRFATIRSFKGLESDIVFLIGLKAGRRTCTDADIYVGASRARFMLQ
ncbi:MAG TPA: hypothetical protein GX529_00175, partial [Firmicutes bacterium]|nr:hypothetical protein [Candidatus Fermentithermobacillaceae bacterium]